MGLSVVSQTRCKIDVFPAFALPITSTRNVIAGNRRLSTVDAVSLSAVRLRLVRLCAVPIGAVVKSVVEELLIDFRFDSQITCSSHTDRPLKIVSLKMRGVAAYHISTSITLPYAILECLMKSFAITY